MRLRAELPVTGSYMVDKDCARTATITPKGHSEIHFSFVVVDSGKEMLAIETDADMVTGSERVLGALQQKSACRRVCAIIGLER